jgi:hypothetical protein
VMRFISIRICMYKLLFIIFLIIFSMGSKCWGQEKLSIPDGTWYGFLPLGGAVACGGVIRQIKIINNIATVKGSGMFGILNHKFTIGEDKHENRIFHINHTSGPYKFNFNSLDNTITLIFYGQCIGEATFKQKKILIDK